MLWTTPIKFNKEDGNINISIESHEGMTEILIKDTGIGIPRSLIGSLFKPFSRIKSAEDFTYEGMGFSLYLAKIIVMDYWRRYSYRI